MQPFIMDSPNRVFRIADNGTLYVIERENDLWRLSTKGVVGTDDFDRLGEIELKYPALQGLYDFVSMVLSAPAIPLHARAEEHDYSFDINLICSVTVKASSHEAALLKLRANLDCASSNLGAWDDSGDPIMAEVSLRGTPRLYESNDPTIPDAEKAAPPIVFEPWTDDLAILVAAALGTLEGEEDSVQQEHHHLMLALRAMLAAMHDGGADRESVLLAHLLLALHKDIADYETTFMDWLLTEVMGLADGDPIKELATEYLALVQNVPEQQRAFARLSCRYCIPETGYVCEDHGGKPRLPRTA